MARDRSIADRIADWLEAYNAIEDTLTPQALTELAGLASAADPQSINVGFNAARIVYENRRTAATVAEAMTHYGLNRRDTED